MEEFGGIALQPSLFAAVAVCYVAVMLRLEKARWMIASVGCLLGAACSPREEVFGGSTSQAGAGGTGGASAVSTTSSTTATGGAGAVSGSGGGGAGGGNSTASAGGGGMGGSPPKCPAPPCPAKGEGWNCDPKCGPIEPWCTSALCKGSVAAVIPSEGTWKLRLPPVSAQAAMCAACGPTNTWWGVRFSFTGGCLQWDGPADGFVGHTQADDLCDGNSLPRVQIQHGRELIAALERFAA